MAKKLKFKDYLLVGSLLFGLFFGAGNLIFPVSLGQNAGANVWSTNLGFLVTGTGLPLLGIIAMGVSQSESVFQIASKVNRTFAYTFTILLYLVIGPFFAIPRLATTSFEVGINPFVSEGQQSLTLLIFSIIFFLVAWFLSQKPNYLLDLIGKILTPTFLVLLSVLFILAFLKPMGTVANIPVQETYQARPFYMGFLGGYNTLDALAALAFGIIITSSIHSMGISDPKELTKDIIFSGIIGVGLMAIIYTLLSMLGAQSIGSVSISSNGGLALSTIVKYYLGSLGQVLLGLIVTVACVKTAIGLLTAFAETFNNLFPRVSYKVFLAVATIIPMLIANLGLTTIISLSIPVLMFIYPLAMVLILLAIIEAFFPFSKNVYQWTMNFTLIAAILDGFKAISETFPTTLSSQWFSNIIQFCNNFIPLYEIGLSWVLPALIGFCIGKLVEHINNNNNIKEPI